MPPNVIQQAPNAGIASIQQGLASIQQLGQFLEQKRQFEEEQKRLNTLQQANWGWTAFKEIMSATESKSPQEVATKFPSIVSLLFERGLGIDKTTAMAFVTSLAALPDNADAAMNRVFSVYTKYGDGSVEGKDAVNEATTEMTKATQATTTPAAATTSGEKKGPAAGTTTQPPILMTPSLSKNRPTSEPITNAPPRALYVLNSVKSDLYPLIQGVAPGNRLAYQNNTTYNSILDSAIKRHPADAAAIADLKKNLPAFIQEVQQGRWKPPITAHLGTVGAPGSPNTPPPPLTIEQAFEGGQPGAPTADLFKREPQTQPPYAQRGPGTEAAAAQGNVPEAQAQPVAQTEFDKSLEEFLSSTEEGGRGRAIVAQKKLEGPMTTAIQAELEKTPEGIKKLVENANYMINNPQTLRMLAMQQNAPSVYATDLAGKGETAAGRLDLVIKAMNLKKLGYEVEAARIGLAKAGVDGQDAQNKAIISGITAAMIQSGNVPPVEMQTRLSDISGKMSAERDAWTKATDQASRDFHAEQLNSLNTQFYGMISAYKSAVGKFDTPEAKKAKALLDSVFAPKQRDLWERFWNMGGQLVRQAPKTEEKKAPSMTQAGAQVSADFGLE